ncbi:hypothetical protein KSS87_015048 [Heliosperma pusillum]|nr:hypothetical protein KSS87_015048 [Heliosperma pusillum]
MPSQFNSVLLPQSPVFLRNDYPLWKRRRLKRPTLLRNSLQPPSFDIFSLLSSNWLPPAVLAFSAAATAAALSLSSSSPAANSAAEAAISATGGSGSEWMLFTSPTPFNRFVLLRCPSVSFEGGELLENVSEKLVREERHYVRLDTGRIAPMAEEERGSEKVELEYQRVCVPVDDGGVISIDFPANLELSEERGLDTTVLIVPGTTQGSMEESIRSFVRECLRSGLFPIVMNPRGCANSPLTTARLFTAADSDDICSAIQFITRARPWSTLTGVGWGYGANMLTKYLAEAGEKTPLIAATCINNPFDLDEATRTSLYNATIDKKVTGGLIDILKSNKELFQGKRKGFDVEKALAAESIREFETAISMVSYGFGSLEDFYASCSTRSIIAKLKIPVLFIQNDDGTVPLFSIPRVLIAENPFTSLLLCSCVPSKVTAISWYQQVTIEVLLQLLAYAFTNVTGWLAAVELGLLKGRHPLLQDIDVTINPSKSLALMEGRSSDTNTRLQRLPNMSEVNGSHSNLDPANKILTESAPAASSNIDLQYDPNSTKNPGSDDHVLIELNSIPPVSRSVDNDSAGDIGATPKESDSGQLLQTAQVVMNMLDVTMPGTFKEEEKRKVVEALGRGESLMNALQDAVPEDVRGKLTTSVSEILQAQGKNLNLDGLLSINQIANLSSGFKSVMKDKVSKLDTSNESCGNPSDDKVSENNGSNKSSNSQSDGVDVICGESPSIQPLEESPKSSDIPASNSVSSHSGDSGLEKGSIDSENSEDKHDGDVSEKKVGQLAEFGDDGSEATVEPIPSSQIPGSTNSFDADSMQINNSQDGNTKEQDFKEINMPTGVEHSEDSSHEQVTSSVTDTKPDDTNQVSPMSEGQPSEKVDDECVSKDEKTVQPLPDQNRVSDAKSPIDVTQALDALTGLDDSTQMAVNSVFGVLEDMVTQLEEKQNEKDKKVGTENNDANGSVLEKNHSSRELQPEKLSDDKLDAGKDQEHACLPDIELINGDNKKETASNENSMKMNLATVANEADKHTRISKVPSNLTTDPFSKALYKEYLKNYMISNLHNVKSFNVDATDGLYLHYVPDEGHWILLENPRGIDGALTHNTKDRTDIAKLANEDDIIETSYAILDKDGGRDTIEKLDPKENLNYKLMNHDSNLDNSISSVEAILSDSLKVEVSRRLNVTDMKEIEVDLAADIQKVAEAVCLTIRHDEEHNQHASISGDVDVLESNWVYGNHVVEEISKAVQDTSYLKRVLPVGVVVGSSLAALRSCGNGTSLAYSDPTRMLDLIEDQNSLVEPKDQLKQKDDIAVEGKIYGPAVENPLKEEGRVTLNSPEEINGEKSHHQLLSRNNLMVGAVTAALGASTLISTQQSQEGFMEGATCEPYANLEETHMKKESRKLVETGGSKHQSNMVASLAEKAMSVAAPVVPTKEDGKVDHERIVNMLAEFGQRGGALRLVAKLALLWGGLRGAMSLTDRLISFLRVAERPLVQRILGFSCMVLVLWSPVLLPLLPTLLHNMATHNSSGISELACIVGLYAAVTILIMQWGKRIRGYEYPLHQYGLDPMSSTKMQDFLTGLVGGIVLVLSIQSVNAFLGFVSFSLPTNLRPSSLNLTAKLKAYGHLFLLASRGLLMSAGVTFVEELLFRSWLLEEVAADLGYHPAIILSGLAFSLSQRSVFAIPGLWLLSVSLAGARLRKEGSIFTPIGLRTGIMSSSFILQTGGFLICQPRSLLWVAGMHPLQPFTGVVGVLVALLLAVALYPRQPGLCGKIPRTIRA